MATYYVDHISGNNSNGGTSWGDAWADFNNGPTAARVAPGDTIKFAKTPDEASTGVTTTFTNNSPSLTLSTALTKNIHLADTSTGWTASTNITVTTTSVRKYGSASLVWTPAAGFTTGKVMYAAVAGGGTQDFSAYQKISFWISPTTSTAIAASTYKLCLCSDTTGDTIVNEIDIPALIANSNPQIVVLDYGGALSSSVQSVAIYALTDPGTTSMRINNIFACNDVTLRTLIGPSGDVNYPIRYINETSMEIDNHQTSGLTGQGYGEATTGTVTMYYQNPSANYNTTSTAQTINEDGSFTTTTLYSGGWNTSSGLQDGYTVLAHDTAGVGSILTTRNYVTIENFKFLRAANGISNSYSNIRVNNCYGIGGSYGVNFSNATDIIMTDCIIQNTNSNCMFGGDVRAINCTFKNNRSGISSASGAQFFNCTFNNNAFSDLSTCLGGRNTIITLRYCLLNNSTEYQQTNAYFNQVVKCIDHDQTYGNHWMLGWNWTANWQTTVYHDTEPGAWKVYPNSSGRTGYPVEFPLGDYAVTAGDPVTVTVWVQKAHATSTDAVLWLDGFPIGLPGITDQSDTKASDTSWEQLSVTATPTQDGVISPLLKVYYNSSTTSYVYAGAVEVTQ